jgi:AIR synthase related protein, N-terminal domain
MFDNGLGCIGKLPLKESRELKRFLNRPDNLWLDAEPLGDLKEACISIDTVAVDHANKNSVVLGLLHCLNDLLAAGAKPAYLTVSLQLAESCEWSELKALQAVLVSFETAMGIPIKKLHTSRVGEQSYLTAATVGIGYRPRPLLAQKGSLYLIGDILPPDSASAEFMRIAKEGFKLRLQAATSFDGPMKDISGDGLAGAAHQLAEMEGCGVILDSAALLTEVDDIPLDDCRRDRNDSDYADMINGFRERSTRILRDVLFAPRFFGPLLCFSSVPPSTPEARVIGEYEVGPPSLSCR